MIDLTVKTLDSQNHVFSLEDDQITVRGFKEHIAESVAVPADSQRLIYCGRVLQDDKKLNDYDVNGKVIHLVQRAPPQSGQHGNDGGQTQGQNRQGWQNSPRSHYRVTRTQMHGNAMYLGAMSVPAEIVEGHGIPQLSNSLSGSRLNHAGRMLDRINELIDRLDDPSAPPLHPTPSELNQSTTQQQQSQEPEVEQNENNDASRDDSGARLAEAAAAAITAALSAAGARAVTLFRGTNYNGGSTRSASGANENQSDTQPQSQSQSHPQTQTQQQQQQNVPQQQQQQQQQAQASDTEAAGSNNAGQNRRAQQQDLPRPSQMAELLQRLNNTQERLRPYLDRYYMLTLVDPSLPPGPGPNTVEDSQRLVDGVSEILHLLSHSCHALSDIIIDMSQQPPRNLRCRPIIVQHSAILQPGIPIQVEAHISLNGRTANNNNSNDESTESGNQQSESADSTSSRINTEEATSQERESDNTQSQGERSQQEQGQSPFDTVFNLPNNVEVLMEVSSSESNVDGGSGNEQNTAGNENNNNGNARRTNVFPFGTGPPPYFMRNFMQAVAGHMVHGGMTTTTISSRNPPITTVAQQSVSTSMDSGTTNTGQSTQARSNTGTHPTTATQTRSTSRPHVFHHHAHPVGLGMSIGLGLDFDPYLPCNSHHVYRTSTSTTSSTTSGVTTSSQTTRTTSTTTTDTQNQTNQTATTSTSTTTNAPPTNTASTTNAETSNNNPFVNLLQQILNQSTVGQSQSNISIDSNAPNLVENLGNIVQMIGNNIHVGFVSDSSNESALTLADLFEGGGLSMDVFTSQEPGREENLLLDLFVFLAQSMTLDGLIRIRLGQGEPIARLRRPLQEFLQYTFSGASSSDVLQEQTIERLLSQLRPPIQNLLASEEDASGRSGSRIDISATIESLITRHVKDILRILFDNEVDDTRFGQEILNILTNLCNQFCTVLRYSLRGSQAGLEAIATRFVRNLIEGGNPSFLQWIVNGSVAHLRNYFLRVPQPPDSEIIPLLVYKDASSQQVSSSVSSASTRQSKQAQSEDEPMETENLEQQQPTLESSISEDREEIPETFPGHEALPSDWVPIIARDGVRQRRQLQGTPNTGVTTFSDAYLGGLPSKRRKLIEQQKPRLLVSPTPNHHSTIAASMERLIREGVGRAGVEEVEGAAVAVAADPAVRRAFGQAIRDCLNPCRYGTPDFPDPLRFPNATKYFAEQERPPK